MGSVLHFLAVLVTGILVVTYVAITYRVRLLFDQLATSAPANGTEYDFIVVGSGSSGSVITRRLAEAGHSVLLVEAGGPSHWLSGVPATVPYWLGSDYDWKYSAEPTKKACRAFIDGGRVKWPRGKVLGGSSILNVMLHARGHSKDYDQWSDMGNPGWSYKEVLPFFKKFQNFVGDVEDKEKYHGEGGPLGVMPTVFVQVAAANDSRPDVQILSMPHTFTVDYGIGSPNAFSISQDNYQAMFGQYADAFSTTQIWPVLLRPKSRGSVYLKSSDPDDHPIITSGYLEHPHDVKTLVEAAKCSYALKDTKTFKDHGLMPMELDKKNCGQHKPLSDEYWECHVRHWTLTVYHQAGTVKMGPDSDPMAVLTSRLKVKGVHGLRVADASIMPNLVGGNTHAPCTMIGERASDFILEDWKSATDHTNKRTHFKEEL